MAINICYSAAQVVISKKIIVPGSYFYIMNRLFSTTCKQVAAYRPYIKYMTAYIAPPFSRYFKIISKIVTFIIFQLPLRVNCSMVELNGVMLRGLGPMGHVAAFKIYIKC